LEIGRTYALPRFNVTPFAALQGSTLWERGFTESSTTGGLPGILGLTYQSQTVTSLPTFLGVQFDTRWAWANGRSGRRSCGRPGYTSSVPIGSITDGSTGASLPPPPKIRAAGPLDAPGRLPKTVIARVWPPVFSPSPATPPRLSKNCGLL